MLWKWCWRLLIVFLGLWLVFDLGSRLGAEIFWFEEVGYLQVFLLRLVTQGTLWVLVAGTSAVYLLGNLTLAKRLKYPRDLKIEPVRREEFRLSSDLKNFLSPQYSSSDIISSPDMRGFPGLRFRWLLPLALGLKFSSCCHI